MKSIASVHIFLNFLVIMGYGQQMGWHEITRDQLSLVFDQTRDWQLNHSNYAMTITHSSFENYTTTVPHEISTGFFRKKENKYHSYLLGIHTIQTSHFKIVVDTTNKTLIVANRDARAFDLYLTDGLSALFAVTSSISEIAIGTDRKYKLEFLNDFPLEHFEMTVAQSGFLNEMVWYYRNPVSKNIDDESAEKTKPRLSVSFSSVRTYTEKSSESEFDESNYFLMEGYKLIPTGKYRDFTLSDQRLNFDE